MVKSYKEYIGQTFNRLTVIKFIKRKNYYDYYLFHCSCGKEKIIQIRYVITERVMSCGCLQLETVIKHGLSKHPLYSVWTGIKQRILSPTCRNYKNYGGRGIKICQEWINNPKAFINWAIQSGWRPGLQIDRIDNNGNYEKSNCRFITNRQNQQNKKPNAIGYKYIYSKNRHFEVNKKINNKTKYFGSFSTIEMARQFCIKEGLYEN